MKVRIRRTYGSQWDLITDEKQYEKMNEPLVLMSISKFEGNDAYEILDFRYSRHVSPPPRRFNPQWNSELLVTPESEALFDQLFDFPVSREDSRLYFWRTFDGCVIDGHDYALESQGINICYTDPSHVWKFKTAKKIMNETKLFWESFDLATSSWAATKIHNPHQKPRGDEVNAKLQWLLGKR